MAVYEKQAREGSALALLMNEARALRTLAGTNAPQILGFWCDHGVWTLRRRFFEGPILGDLAPDLWPPLLSRLERDLATIHGRGLVHGDLKPSNLVLNGMVLTPIDWEHALRIGEPISDQPVRAVSPGYSHPRLIWARGTVEADLDFHAIDRMKPMPRIHG